MSITIYAIGESNHVVAGHGDSYTEVVIRRAGAYGSEGFRPVFMTAEEAQQYIDQIKYHSDLRIVTLELIDGRGE